jgi:hypothetical protein
MTEPTERLDPLTKLDWQQNVFTKWHKQAAQRQTKPSANERR